MLRILGFPGLLRASQGESTYQLVWLKRRHKERLVGAEGVVEGQALPGQTPVFDQATIRKSRACRGSHVLLGEKQPDLFI